VKFSVIVRPNKLARDNFGLASLASTKDASPATASVREIAWAALIRVVDKQGDAKLTEHISTLADSDSAPSSVRCPRTPTG
jgi:hypothetical protein